MELNLTREESFRQEIRCTDCGHKYLLFRKQLSCRCPRCGNIEYIPAPAQARKPEPLDEIFLQKFRQPVLSTAVEEVLLCYMQEWDLWAALVDNFENPAFHSAYLSTMMRERALAPAALRYRKHLNMMKMISGEGWQCEIAKIQLTRISQLQLVEADRSLEKILPFNLPEWLFHYERTQKLLWILTGMILWACMTKIYSGIL